MWLQCGGNVVDSGVRGQETGVWYNPKIQKSLILRQSCTPYMFFKSLIFEISVLKTRTTVQLVQPHRGCAESLDPILPFKILKKPIGCKYGP